MVGVDIEPKEAKKGCAWSALHAHPFFGIRSAKALA